MRANDSDTGVRSGNLPPLFVFLLGGLIALLYARVFKLLVLQWWKDPDYTYGFLVPFFSLYVFLRKRAALSRIPFDPANQGVIVVIGSIGLLIFGSLGAELFLTRISFVSLLAGMIVYFAGWKMLRTLAFPLGFLVFMIPFPRIIYSQLTFPLQLMASRFAGLCLDILHVPVLREGNLLFLPNYTLEVVEACSGIRSLMALVTLATAYGSFVERRTWTRIVLVVSMLPIAVISNSLRVVATGLIAYVFRPGVAEGFFHLFAGWLVFAVALLFMFLSQQLLARPEKQWKATDA